MRCILAFGLLMLAACQSAPSTGASASRAPAPSGMTALLNSERAALGHGPLIEDGRLSRAAQEHAQDMVDNNYFAHQGRNGSSFVNRARDAGYMCAAAENIASGQPSEARVVRGWMMSPGHRRNILLAEAVEFGIGRVGTMWVLVLGRGC